MREGLQQLVPPTKLKIARPEVESFYHLADRPMEHALCNGTACFVARHLNPNRWALAGQQSARVYCLGKCFAAPAGAEDQVAPHVEVRSRAGVVLGRLVSNSTRAPPANPVRSEHGQGLDHYISTGRYQGLQMALRLLPDQIVGLIESSGLRGRGGAGFPTGRKWRAVLSQPVSPKYVVANADEGDAGAYIDRFIMENDPHALIEGMLIAAHAVGASRGFIYLRKEYPGAKHCLELALLDARRSGLLGAGNQISSVGFDIELIIGQGSYVCGEETAMLNSIEGLRPEVRARPPHAAQQGLWKSPTLINNVETFVSVPWILTHGAEAYHDMGFSRSRGTKVISLNSLFRQPGLYEVEFGVTVRRIVEEIGGGLHSGLLKGVLIGGPLAGIIPPRLLDTPFAFEELQAIGASVGHGGVIAFDHHTSIAALLHHVFSFGAYESCGKCTPCRLGSRRIANVFRNVLDDKTGDSREKAECQLIISALKLASLCGLGTGLAEFAESALRYYGEELQTCFR